jgi:hypothetical protein
VCVGGVAAKHGRRLNWLREQLKASRSVMGRS